MGRTYRLRKISTTAAAIATQWWPLLFLFSASFIHSARLLNSPDETGAQRLRLGSSSNKLQEFISKHPSCMTAAGTISCRIGSTQSLHEVPSGLNGIGNFQESLKHMIKTRAPPPPRAILP